MEGLIWIAVGMALMYFPIKFLRDERYAQNYIRKSPKAFIWRKLFGEEKAIKITKAVFIPLIISLGIVLIISGIFI